MRLYDIVVLVTPELNDEDAAKVAADYRKILADGGGNIVKDDPWGRRRLAYPILRKREAYYHYFQVSAEPAIIAETERRMKLSDQVLRHLAVRADLELKRSAKMAVRLKEKAARPPPRRRSRRESPHEPRTPRARRRRQPRRQDRSPEEVFRTPPQGLQVLRGKARVRRLEGRQAPAGIHPGAREDPAAPHLGDLRSSPAQAADRDQARPVDRAAAVRDGLVGTRDSGHGTRGRTLVLRSRPLFPVPC